MLTNGRYLLKFYQQHGWRYEQQAKHTAMLSTMLVGCLVALVLLLLLLLSATWSNFIFCYISELHVCVLTITDWPMEDERCGEIC